jgi:hypothetical protein
MKLQSIIQGMVLAAIVLLATQAFAQPVILMCNGNGHIVDNRSMVIWITFDEASGTAFSGDNPASSASFTNTNIKWSGRWPNQDRAISESLDWNLNRITGLLTVRPDTGSRAVEFDCVVAPEKKF